MSGAPWVFKRCRVINVVDGDTVDLEIDLGFFCATKVRARLYGVDTPERGQPGWAEATLRLRELAPIGSNIIVHSYKPKDKYGRFLAVLFAPEGGSCSINQQLINEGLAKVYE